MLKYRVNIVLVGGDGNRFCKFMAKKCGVVFCILLAGGGLFERSVRIVKMGFYYDVKSSSEMCWHDLLMMTLFMGVCIAQRNRGLKGYTCHVLLERKNNILIRFCVVFGDEKYILM